MSRAATPGPKVQLHLTDLRNMYEIRPTQRLQMETIIASPLNFIRRGRMRITSPRSVEIGPCRIGPSHSILSPPIDIRRLYSRSKVMGRYRAIVWVSACTHSPSANRTASPDSIDRAEFLVRIGSGSALSSHPKRMFSDVLYAPGHRAKSNSPDIGFWAPLPKSLVTDR